MHPGRAFAELGPRQPGDEHNAANDCDYLPLRGRYGVLRSAAALTCLRRCRQRGWLKILRNAVGLSFWNRVHVTVLFHDEIAVVCSDDHFDLASQRHLPESRVAWDRVDKTKRGIKTDGVVRRRRKAYSSVADDHMNHILSLRQRRSALGEQVDLAATHSHPHGGACFSEDAVAGINRRADCSFCRASMS